MIKKIILLIISALFMVTEAYADDSRWIRVEGNNDTWLDKNTATYNQKTGDITYWIKFVPKEGESFLKEYKANIHQRTLAQIYEVKEGPGDNHEEINGYRRGHILISPDSNGEKEANLACEVLNLKPILGSKKHTWKYLKTINSRVGLGMEYICTDMFIYNHDKQIVHVYLKSIYANNRSIKYEANVKIKEHMVARVLGQERIAAPDTLEEAIYDATLEMVNRT